MKENLIKEGQEADFRPFGFSLYGYKEDFVELIKKDAKILDVGCGNGHFLEYLKEKGYTDLWGIDIVERAVNETKDRLDKSFKIQQMDIHATDFSDDIFDAVSASHVIEHSPFPRAIVREMVRITKPGGFVFFDIPIEVLNEGPAHFSFFHSPEQFLSHLERIKVIKQQKSYGEYSNHFFIIGYVVK